MKIKISELENIALKALSKNYPADEAKRICDVVMFGQMSGKLSHGLNRLVGGARIVF